MIVAVNTIYAIAKRSLKKIQDFNGVWTRDLTITGVMLFISFPQFIYDLFHISLTAKTLLILQHESNLRKWNFGVA